MFKQKSENLIPQDKLITFNEIVQECKKRKLDASVRTIRYYITEGLLPKPMYIKKVAYYDKDYIVDELEAIHVLRTLFGKGIKEIAELAKNAFGSLKDIVSELHDILDHKYFKSLSKHKERPLGFRYVNSKLMQYLAEQYFVKIKKGWWASKMNSEEFIDSVIDDYQEKMGGKE